MRSRFCVVLIALSFALSFPGQPLAREPAITDAFSPRQGATELVVNTIDKARKSIRVAAYSFTSKPIAVALVRAHQRGVDVEVVLDKSQRKRSRAGFLKESGIPVRINRHYAIMHNKFMIIDAKVLELGSFNYTKSAEEKNAENVLVLRNRTKIIKDYMAQWQKLWEEGEDVLNEN